MTRGSGGSRLLFSDFCIVPFCRSDADVASMARGRAIEVRPGPGGTSPLWFDHTPTGGPTVVARPAGSADDKREGSSSKAGATATADGADAVHCAMAAKGGAGDERLDPPLASDDPIDRNVLEPWDLGPDSSWVPSSMAGGGRLLQHSFIGRWLRATRQRLRSVSAGAGAGAGASADLELRIRPTVWIPGCPPCWVGMPVVPPEAARSTTPVQLHRLPISC